MGFVLRVEEDHARDILFLYPCGHIETETDCAVWLSQYDAMNERYPNASVIAIMDMFQVSPAVEHLYLRNAKQFTDRFNGFGVIVDCSSTDSYAVVNAVNSKNRLFFAPTTEQAITLLLEVRRARGR